MTRFYNIQSPTADLGLFPHRRMIWHHSNLRRPCSPSLGSLDGWVEKPWEDECMHTIIKLYTIQVVNSVFITFITFSNYAVRYLPLASSNFSTSPWCSPLQFSSLKKGETQWNSLPRSCWVGVGQGSASWIGGIVLHRFGDKMLFETSAWLALVCSLLPLGLAVCALGERIKGQGLKVTLQQSELNRCWKKGQ